MTKRGTPKHRRAEGEAMSFLYVTQYFPPEVGAVPARLGAITEQLVARGHRVEVVTTLPNYPTGRILPGWSKRPVQVGTERKMRVVRVWSWPAMGNGLGRILNYVTFGVASVVGLMLSRPADWVVVEYPTLFGALPAVVWCRLRGRKVVVNVADLWLDVIVTIGGLPDGLVVKVLRRLERWMLLHADAVMFVTEGMRDVMVGRGVDLARTAWLPNGADTDRFRPGPSDPAVRERLGLAPGEAMVLYAGTQGYVHRLEVALEAAELLADRPVRFVLVGGGSEGDALRDLARAKGLTNVTFMDPVPQDQLEGLQREATVGLVSVRAGDTYASIRSAKMWPIMATATPVVYSADDEGSRLVTSIGAGIATPAEDSAALAAAIVELIDHPDQAADYGRAGREWVEANASWRHLVGVWLGRMEEVDRLVDDGRAGGAEGDHGPV
jgi:glycosyltransferase involved in cell wall biosynthesis